MGNKRRQMTLAEYKGEGERLFGNDVAKWKYRCARCGEVQTLQDFIDAGLTEREAWKYIAFSCIGRFVEGRGCDWTLGGLFQIHTLEVIDEEAKIHRRFEFADADLTTVTDTPATEGTENE